MAAHSTAQHGTAQRGTIKYSRGQQDTPAHRTAQQGEASWYDSSCAVTSKACTAVGKDMPGDVSARKLQASATIGLVLPTASVSAPLLAGLNCYLVLVLVHGLSEK
jgi:hypothetical protein